MIVLDTTVLVYAVGDAHPFREPCRRLVTAIANGRLDATTTVEVIQEAAHVRARRRGRADAARFARDWLALLTPLLVPDEHALAAGLELFEANDRLGAFDCVLAATAMHSGAGALVSADSAFGALDGIRHVVPDNSGVDGLLKSA